MYAYCVGKLHMSEEAAYKRIQAGRAARRFPAIFEALAAGRIHLSGAVMLAAHLTPDNADELVEGACHKTKAQIELLLAERFPQPDLVTSIAPMALTPGTTTEWRGPVAPERPAWCGGTDVPRPTAPSLPR